MFKKELSQIQSVVVSNLKYFVLLIFSIISVGIIEYTFPYVYRLVVDEVLVRKSLEQMPRFVLAYVVLVTLLVGLATLRSFARSTLSVHSTKCSVGLRSSLWILIREFHSSRFNRKLPIDLYTALISLFNPSLYFTLQIRLILNPSIQTLPRQST